MNEGITLDELSDKPFMIGTAHSLADIWCGGYTVYFNQSVETRSFYTDYMKYHILFIMSSVRAGMSSLLSNKCKFSLYT